MPIQTKQLCMKNHFSSLFEPSHRQQTILYFIISVVLIVASEIAGLTDNLIGIAALLTGVCFLFYTLLHTWKRGRSYAIMAWIFAGIILLTLAVIYLLSILGYEQYLSRGVVMFIMFLICLPGIIVGILGAIFND
jgi:hypothetical protein